MNTCTPEEYIVTMAVSEEEYHARVSKIESKLKQAVDRYTARNVRSIVYSNEMIHDDRRVRTHSK
jgi:hypothetical protein